MPRTRTVLYDSELLIVQSLSPSYQVVDVFDPEAGHMLQFLAAKSEVQRAIEDNPSRLRGFLASDVTPVTLLNRCIALRAECEKTSTWTLGPETYSKPWPKSLVCLPRNWLTFWWY